MDKILILSFLFFGSWSVQAIEVRFEDLEKMVLEKNGHVVAADRSLKAADAEVGFLLRSYLPRISGTLGLESFKTGSFTLMNQPLGSIEANLNLFRGGRDLLENELRNRQYDLALNEKNLRYRDELVKARRDFWSLVYTKEVIEILKESLKKNEKYLSAAKRRVSAGMGAETDKYEFEIYQTQLEQDIARLTLQQQNLERILSASLGMEPGSSVLPIGITHQHDETLSQSNMLPENQFDSKSLFLNENIYDLQSSQAARWWIPSLDLYANYSLYTFRERDYLARSDRYESVVGAKMTFLFFDGLVGRSIARAEGFRAQAAREIGTQTYRETQANFDNAKAELKLTHDLVHGAERTVEQSQKYLNGTLSEYQRGLKNSPDVFSASQRYIEYKRRLAELKRDYNLARVELSALLNK